MTRQYFGTDGIRGKVGTYPITPEFVLKLGWAAGRVLSRQGTRKVIIGKDTRISGYMLESALEAGLSAAGVDAVLTGPLPTPAIAYITKAFRAEAGIVISASHNPFDDNGIKFFSTYGEKLPDDVELAIEAELDHPLVCVAPDLLGKASRIADAAGRYIEFCKGTFPSACSLESFKIVVDCAHGAAYYIGPAVFEELGATVIAIGNQPDGLNINRGCGATDLSLLRQAVVDNGAHLGIALDGDADRLMMVDSQGNTVNGDQILLLLASHAQQSGAFTGGVVGTLMSNMGLEIALAERNIPFVRTNVGDRYVMEQLVARNWSLGGESSGHIICRDLVTTGDAIVAALQVLAAIKQSGQSFEALLAPMQVYPQTMINVRCSNDSNPLDNKAVTDIISAANHALGVGTSHPKGRLLIRKSGTEPVIRVMVEAQDQHLAESWASSIARTITSTV